MIIFVFQYMGILLVSLMLNVADYNSKRMFFFFSFRHAEGQIGLQNLKFPCLDGDCDNEFSLTVLKSVLKSSTFSNLLKRKQAEEIEAAGIANLESCPFCNFATIMPNEQDKVL